ncbi:MAG TPA: hypothetical protein VN643_14195 [Pyrinomonadaceae bacterium]|nr:hypothetical protein [Pyrinomonadaceae bacterium]
MIKLRRTSLPAVAKKNLGTFQSKIDILADYAQKVAAAKTQFSLRNNRRNQTFVEVRKALTKMCAGARRCVYCEDSCADEIEHIKPKDLYPESTFLWENYVYACGPCNGPKNNHFAVFSAATGLTTDITRGRGEPIVEPELGSPVLINPRWEDPLRFMELDLLDTFFFLPTKPKGSRDWERADYTIKVLKLNERDVLLKARKEAYDSYEARLSHYITLRKEGEAETRLRTSVRALRRMQHPTVWKEMKRQHHVIPALSRLFVDAPEALAW